MISARKLEGHWAPETIPAPAPTAQSDPPPPTQPTGFPHIAPVEQSRPGVQRVTCYWCGRPLDARHERWSHCPQQPPGAP